jgi:hypothetical protein
MLIKEQAKFKYSADVFFKTCFWLYRWLRGFFERVEPLIAESWLTVLSSGRVCATLGRVDRFVVFKVAGFGQKAWRL